MTISLKKRPERRLFEKTDENVEKKD